MKYIAPKRRTHNRISLTKSVSLIAIMFVMLFGQAAHAVDQYFYSNNDILYYNPDDTCADVVQSGGGCGEAKITAATYNVLQGEHHANICGSKNNKPCMTKRSEKQAKIITGKDGGKAIDVVGLQEVSPYQYKELKRLLPDYGVIPKDTSRLSNLKDGAVAIFYNKEKFKLVDQGKHEGMGNVPSNFRGGSNEKKGIVTYQWAALEAQNGVKLYVSTAHWPRPTYAAPTGGETKNQAFNRHLKKGVELTRDWVQSETSDGVALFMGDFNDGGGTTAEARKITYCGLSKTGLLQHAWDMANKKNSSKECPSLGKGLPGGIDQLYLTPKDGVSASNYRRITSPSTVGASDHQPVAVDITLTGTDCGSSGSGGGEGSSEANGSLDAFLKAFAMQESGGNPKAANPGSSARGKYQYITTTWTSRKPLYPPSGGYATADKAPESVQDAVMYIEYAQKWKAFNGSLFKMAVSHFYPAANTNPALLDVHVGPSSNPTPREYANSVVDKVKKGYGSEIKLYYKDAPDFDKYLSKAVGADTNFSGVASTATPSSSGLGDCGDSKGGSIGNQTVEEGGLNEEQAKQLMMNYGENKNGDSEKTMGASYWASCSPGGRGSNCVSFSRFFINKFSNKSAPTPMGNGIAVVGNLRAAGFKTGNVPKVFSVFSMPNSDQYGHTGIVLGVEGDTIIVGHASCGRGRNGIGGRGDGTITGTGSGFIKVGSISTGDAWLASGKPTEFAYPDVDTNKIQDYINGKI